MASSRNWCAVRSPWAERQRGSVTAEFATVLPAVLVVLAGCLGAVQVVGQQVRLTDAAGSVARLLARGESADHAAGLLGGQGASVSHERVGEFVCARLTAPSGFTPFAAAGLTLDARACALAGPP